MLARVEDRSAGETAANLGPAISEGFIAPLSGLEAADPDALDAPLVYGRFAFLHDRVQQAAYATLSAHDKPALHLAIGRALLAGASAPQVEARLFDIVNHLNHGSELIVDRRRALAARRAQRARGREGARRDGLRARGPLLPERGDAARRRGLGRALRRAMRRAPAARGESRPRRRLSRRVRRARRGARARALVDRPHEALHDQDERAADHGPDSGRARVRPRRRARSMGSTCPRSASRCGRACSRRSRRSSRGPRRSVSSGCSTCRVMTDPANSALRALLAHCLPAAYQYDQDSYALLTCTMVRAVARARQLAAVGARVRLVRGADRERAQVVRRGLSLREARRGPRAQAQRPVGALRRLLPLGDVRVALEAADRRERRPLSAEHPVRSPERRPFARGLQRGAPLLASAVPRHAARRAPRRRQGRARSAAADRRRDQHGVRRAAAALDRLAPGRAPPRRHARQRRARRDGVHRDHPGARQPLVRVRLVPAARDPALPLAATSPRRCASRRSPRSSCRTRPAS